MLRRICLPLLCAACGMAQSIQGTVVNSVTGSGIPNVKVELMWSGDFAYAATTDNQGRFVFEHVQEGAYTVSYTAEGYEWIGLFSNPPEPRLYRATAGKTVEIVSRLMPMGHVSGRVLDPSGKPVPKAVVEVQGPGIQMGLQADAEGRFDFRKITFPGAYTISAIPPSGFAAPDRVPDDDRIFAWTRTWYPGVTDPGGAGKVVLTAGGSVENLDLKLKTAPGHSIRGILIQPGGKPVADIEVMLSSAKGLFKAKTAEDGAFQFLAPDGDWRLSAEAQPSFLNAKLRANQFVTVAGRDREVKLSLDPPIAITLRAVPETPAGTPVPKFIPRTVMLAAVDSTGLALSGDRVLAQPQPDGSFELAGVYPRSYAVGAVAPAGYYLDSVRVGESALPGHVVDLTAGAVVTLVYKADGATLRGKVEDCGGGGVLLVPQDASRRSPEDIARVSCASGRYEFTAIRPGGYYVLALAKDPSAYFWAEDWRDAMMNQAAGITLRPNETSALDLRAVQR
jgi:hypothetical protein